jgi:hypothetical protein
MTLQNKQRIEIALLALAFGIGGGWAAFQFKLNDLSAKVQRIDERVAAMYCSTLPADRQAACR